MWTAQTPEPIRISGGSAPWAEACDDGVTNGTPQSCCTASCDFVAELTPCDDGNACTVGDSCGSSGVCLPGTHVASPGEVANVLFGADKSSIVWDPIPGAPAGTVYDAARGLVGELPVGSGASETCLQADMPGPLASDASLPAAQEAHWYLLRGRHVCGTGTYGTQATNGVPGAERVTAVCP